jgi:hypothetical protein
MLEHHSRAEQHAYSPNGAKVGPAKFEAHVAQRPPPQGEFNVFG